MRRWVPDCALPRARLGPQGKVARVTHASNVPSPSPRPPLLPQPQVTAPRAKSAPINQAFCFTLSIAFMLVAFMCVGGGAAPGVRTHRP